MTDPMSTSTHSMSNQTCQKTDHDMLEVDNLVKYFPIKGGFVATHRGAGQGGG